MVLHTDLLHTEIISFSRRESGGETTDPREKRKARQGAFLAINWRAAFSVPDTPISLPLGL